MSARGSDLPGVTTVKMLEAVMRGYQRALVKSIKSEEPPAALAQTFRYALSRRWRHLARNASKIRRRLFPSESLSGRS